MTMLRYMQSNQFEVLNNNIACGEKLYMIFYLFITNLTHDFQFRPCIFNLNY